MSALLPSLLVSLALASAPDARDYFKITVVDQETGRGVPLVELRTVHQIRRVTDSAGVVAFNEPGLMTQRVFFHVSSHGYEFAQDGFGYAGTRLQVVPGGSAVLKIRRVNIAERLYRVTGAGIYRDSVLVGDQPPTPRPLLNGRVLGSDSVVNTVYRGSIHWFWGDTNRPSYPLGNFHVPGATSALPDAGGLDPEVGVDLTYFLGEDGFAKPTAELPGQGPTWIDGVVTVSDQDGRERLMAKYVKIKPPMEVYERGLIEFDDKRQQFGKRLPIPLDAPLQPQGHPLLHTENGIDYVYFGHPFPHIRVPATAEALRDLSQYKAFTCLKPSAREAEAEVDRDEAGKPRFAWRSDTPPVVGKLRQNLIQQKKLQQDEGFIHLQNVETGKPVMAHGGSVYWNAFRKRWVAIILESFGTSVLGEIWYAEADTPLGPWVYARKIVTHEKYSFYNPKQHPMFDKDEGRTIFFEGTYTNTFSGNSVKTPRYDYNQLMYKLDLTDSRLVLPVPVYHRQGKPSDGPPQLVTGESLRSDERHGDIAWFALDRPSLESRPVFAERAADGGVAWRLGHAPGDRTDPQERPRDNDLEGPQALPAARRGQPLFHALPADLSDPPKTSIPLHEFVNEETKRRTYAIRTQVDLAGYQPTGKVVCLVWPSPVDALPPDPDRDTGAHD